MARSFQRPSASSSTPGASGSSGTAAAAVTAGAAGASSSRGRAKRKLATTPRKLPARKTVNRARRKFYLSS